MRLQPRHARSRRCQLKAGTAGGRTCALEAARAARTLCGLDALRLPSLAPLPALRTSYVGAPRRKPPRLSGACSTWPLLSLCAGRFAAIQGGFLRSRFGSGGPHAYGCGPVTLVRVGAHQPLGPGLRGCRLPRPCSGPTGVGRAYGSAPAPAGTARCPAAAAPTHPPALHGRGRVALCRHGACHFVCKPRPRRASMGAHRIKTKPSRAADGRSGLGCSLQAAQCSSELAAIASMFGCAARLPESDGTCTDIAIDGALTREPILFERLHEPLPVLIAQWALCFCIQFGLPNQNFDLSRSRTRSPSV